VKLSEGLVFFVALVLIDRIKKNVDHKWSHKFLANVSKTWTYIVHEIRCYHPRILNLLYLPSNSNHISIEVFDLSTLKDGNTSLMLCVSESLPFKYDLNFRLLGI